MPLTTDPNDPRLKSGAPDTEPVPQNAAYLVLSDEELAKGFIRPVRRSYLHVGTPHPKYPLLDLTDEQNERYAGLGYVKYEKYPESESPMTGAFWTQKQLDGAGKGCKTVTTMNQAIAETYARDPYFYGATYCAHCQKHLSVDEFVWVDDGTAVGS